MRSRAAFLPALLLLVACTTQSARGEVSTPTGTVARQQPIPVGTSSLMASPSPTLSQASPSPSRISTTNPPPIPAGVRVASQVLPPARVLPYAPLCATPVQVYQDGNAGPLFCLGGPGLNVDAWRFFERQLHPRVMSLGPQVTLAEIEAAVCADNGPGHLTIPEADSAYSLAARYYGWLNINGAPGHGFDASAFLSSGGCS